MHRHEMGWGLTVLGLAAGVGMLGCCVYLMSSQKQQVSEHAGVLVIVKPKGQHIAASRPSSKPVSRAESESKLELGSDTSSSSSHRSSVSDWEVVPKKKVEKAAVESKIPIESPEEQMLRLARNPSVTNLAELGRTTSGLSLNLTSGSEQSTNDVFRPQNSAS